MITALSRFRSLAVVARTSSFQFDPRATDVRRLARVLGARYVVEGSVRRVSGRLRLTLQLIDGESGAHLWAEILEPQGRAASDAFDEVAGRAAAMIEAQVHLAEIGRAERERPDSLEAYDFYLRGRRHVISSRQDDNAASFPLFVKGLELTPNNVQMLAAAAEVIHHRKGVGWQRSEGMTDRVVLELIRRGLERPDLDGASLGLFANALHTAGEADLGASAAERAVAMNPNSPLVLVCAGQIYAWQGDAGGAERVFGRAVELSYGDPTQRFGLEGLAKAARLRGDYARSLDSPCAASPSVPACPAPTGTLSARPPCLDGWTKPGATTPATSRSLPA